MRGKAHSALPDLDNRAFKHLREASRAALEEAPGPRNTRFRAPNSGDKARPGGKGHPDETASMQFRPGNPSSMVHLKPTGLVFLGLLAAALPIAGAEPVWPLPPTTAAAANSR